MSLDTYRRISLETSKLIRERGIHEVFAALTFIVAKIAMTAAKGDPRVAHGYLIEEFSIHNLSDLTPYFFDESDVH